jgi:hypothetical protein
MSMADDLTGDELTNGLGTFLYMAPELVEGAARPTVG